MGPGVGLSQGEKKEAVTGKVKIRALDAEGCGQEPGQVWGATGP